MKEGKDGNATRSFGLEDGRKPKNQRINPRAFRTKRPGVRGVEKMEEAGRKGRKTVSGGPARGRKRLEHKRESVCVQV